MPRRDRSNLNLCKNGVGSEQRSLARKISLDSEVWDRFLFIALPLKLWRLCHPPWFRSAKEALEALSSALVSLCPAHMGWTKQRGSSSTLSKQAYQATRWNQTRCWSGTVTWDDLNRAWSWEMLFSTNWSRTTMQEGCSNFVADCTLSLLVLQSKCSILLDM